MHGRSPGPEAGKPLTLSRCVDPWEPSLRRLRGLLAAW